MKKKKKNKKNVTSRVTVACNLLIAIGAWTTFKFLVLITNTHTVIRSPVCILLVYIFYGHVCSYTVFVFSWKLDYEELKFSKRFEIARTAAMYLDSLPCLVSYFIFFFSCLRSIPTTSVSWICRITVARLV